VAGLFSPDLNSQKSATGVKNADNSQCPAFCYRITVSNMSPAGIEIRNLVVTDDSVPDPNLNLAGCNFGTLAPGASASCVVPAVTHCQDTRDVVTAMGEGFIVTSGTSVGVTPVVRDTNNVLVLNINIECQSTLFSSMDIIDATCNGTPNTADDCVLVLPDNFTGPVRYTLTLRNTGTAPLEVTSITGLPAGLVDCDTGAPIIVPPRIPIPPGQTYVLTACLDVVDWHCQTNLDFNVRAHAEASDTFNNMMLCVYTSTGERVADDTNPADCQCHICCFFSPEIACRTTGGGDLYPGFVDQSCIPVVTQIFPSAGVDHISHGGQLGAPFSQMDCGAILGNPCIRGEWEHQRHYQGNGNPRDVIDMNFHSTNPKGVFDSLSCACLGCCDPVTGAFIPPTQGPLIHKYAICNPDDHKICGPQPRPAPANALIFSGIGRITPTDDISGPRANRSEWVIFRVYIEDRSEPGGAHPGGAVEPADIYCFQAWKTGIKTSRKPDFTTVSTAFRMALGEANCDFLEALKSGALPIGTMPSPTVNGLTADIQDCGPLFNGNRQIHPATGATCD